MKNDKKEHNSPMGFVLDELPTLVVVRTCKHCGCTDADCRQCIQKTGEPCSWVSQDECSACTEEDYPTGQETLSLVEKLESFTGMSCQHFRELSPSASDKDKYEAWRLDRQWFRGYADTIHTLT